MVSNGSTFTMPASAVTVSAQFEGSPQTLRASLAGSTYGSFTVKVNSGDPVTVSGENLVEIPGVITDDTITVSFQPKENGCVGEFYLEDTDYREYHHESDILNNTWSFTMPAESRTIFVRFVILNPVQTVSYIDENGAAHSVQDTVLTGDEDKDLYEQRLRVKLGEKTPTPGMSPRMISPIPAVTATRS